MYLFIFFKKTLTGTHNQDTEWSPPFKNLKNEK